MAKLDDSAKSEAALVILAMNASHRLALWLAHFFSSLFSPPLSLVFQ